MERTMTDDEELVARVAQIVADVIEREYEAEMAPFLRAARQACGVDEDEIVQRSEELGRIAGQLVVEARHRFSATLKAMRDEGRRPQPLPEWPRPIPLRVCNGSRE
jgi:hypothetical protein